MDLPLLTVRMPTTTTDAADVSMPTFRQTVVYFGAGSSGTGVPGKTRSGAGATGIITTSLHVAVDVGESTHCEQCYHRRTCGGEEILV